MRLARSEPDLVDVLTCPRCRREQLDLELEAYRGIAKCWRRACDGRRWFAMRLDTGAIHPQLINAYDVALATELMTWFHLPANLTAAKLWQVSLTLNQYQVYGSAGSSQLLRGLVDQFRASGVAAPRMEA